MKIVVAMGLVMSLSLVSLGLGAPQVALDGSRLPSSIVKPYVGGGVPDCASPCSVVSTIDKDYVVADTSCDVFPFYDPNTNGTYQCQKWQCSNGFCWKTINVKVGSCTSDGLQPIGCPTSSCTDPIP